MMAFFQTGGCQLRYLLLTTLRKVMTKPCSVEKHLFQFLPPDLPWEPQRAGKGEVVWNRGRCQDNLGQG